jgi:hypothetical protein
MYVKKWGINNYSYLEGKERKFLLFLVMYGLRMVLSIHPTACTSY